MLINDNREVAKTLNSMMVTPHRTAPRHPREVQWAEGFLFGHYDSRGGASFIEARHAKPAIELYASKFSFEDGDDLETFDVAMADYEGPHQVVIFDTPLAGDGETDIDYGGTHKVGILHHSVHYAHDGKWHHRGATRILVLYQGAKPPMWETTRHRPRDGEVWATDRWKVVKADIGEDAFGLVWEVLP